MREDIRRTKRLLPNVLQVENNVLIFHVLCRVGVAAPRSNEGHALPSSRAADVGKSSAVVHARIPQIRDELNGGMRGFQRPRLRKHG
ncbi:MAG: hypothetical protein WA996_26185 [Candidatus Promineifilaceae bacterium]